MQRTIPIPFKYSFKYFSDVYKRILVFTIPVNIVARKCYSYHSWTMTFFGNIVALWDIIIQGSVFYRKTLIPAIIILSRLARESDDRLVRPIDSSKTALCIRLAAGPDQTWVGDTRQVGLQRQIQTAVQYAGRHSPRRHYVWIAVCLKYDTRARRSFSR